MSGPLPQYRVVLTPEQVTSLTDISLSYTSCYSDVVRARILLLAHHNPQMHNAEIARRVGCCRETVCIWRRRWLSDKTLRDRPRSGGPRFFSPLVRAQVVALACSNPKDSGKVFTRWSGEKLATAAVEKKIVDSIGASTVRLWLRQDKIKPWRYKSWMHATDPNFVERAGLVLDLYERAQALAEQGEAVVCTDEKPSIQAREGVDEPRPAQPASPMQVAARYLRRGALQLFCALMVATGLTFSRCRQRKRFADFQAFLNELFGSALCRGLTVVHLILDNGPTHAPKQLGDWIAGLELRFEVRIYWLPKYASWLDQVEIIFSKVQRDLLTPNHFTSRAELQDSLMTYFAEINRNPKPVRWTYTKAKMLAKFAPAA
jgi:hypothetical protein